MESASTAKNRKNKGPRPHVLLAVIFFPFLAILAVVSMSFASFLRNLSILVVVFFIIYLVRHLAFAWAALTVRWRPREAVRDVPVYLPTVSVIVPTNSEDRVIGRLIKRLMEMDYPRDKYQVIVVDDASTDQTPAILEKLSEVYPELTVVRRTEEERKRSLGKAEVLDRGLKEATGEIIVVYDADHVPRHDAVMRLVRHFADPMVGAVMGRCKIINKDVNILTKLIYLDYLSGYHVNEYGREVLYNLPAYGGSNCALRKSLVDKYGGFDKRSVTEDTDITTRIILDGYKVVYDREALDEEEAVTHLSRFYKQRYRWAWGHQHIFYDFWLETIKSKHLSPVEKLEFLLFLFVFHAPVVMFLGIVLTFLWGFGIFVPVDFPLAALIWALLFLGPFIEIGSGIIAEWREGGALPHPIHLVFFMPLFLISIFTCTKAFVDGLIYPLIGRGCVWVKTARMWEKA